MLTRTVGIWEKLELNFVCISCQLYLVYQQLGARWGAVSTLCHAHNLNLGVTWNLTAVSYKAFSKEHERLCIKSLRVLSHHTQPSWWILSGSVLSKEVPGCRSQAVSNTTASLVPVCDVLALGWGIKQRLCSCKKYDKEELPPNWTKDLSGQGRSWEVQRLLMCFREIHSICNL